MASWCADAGAACCSSCGTGSRCESMSATAPLQSTAPGTAPAKLFDCRDAYSQSLEAMAEQDPRVCAVVNDSVSSTKLKNFGARFPRSFCERGNCRAEHGRRWRWLGQWRHGPLRMRRILLPDRPCNGTSQGRSWLLELQREAVRNVLGDGLRRVGANASLHRGPCLDAHHPEPLRHCSR